MGDRDVLQPHVWRRRVVGGLLAPLLLSLALLGCGSGPGDPFDGDAQVDANDSDAGFDLAGPMAPEIPWLTDGMPAVAAPLLTPCPEGWHEVTDDDPGSEVRVVTCDPYGIEPDGTEPDACPDGWAHFVGDAGCTPVGAPCPTGDFPEALPTDVAVLYVLSSAPFGGDGGEAAPFRAITEALNVASAGTVIAIGKGEYDEALRLPLGVTLWGACAAETRLLASTWGPLAQGVITVPSADVHLKNLRIGPAELPGLAAYGPRTAVSVDGVIIEDVRVRGLYVTREARVDGQELFISGTRSDGAGGLGRGIEATSGGAVDIERVWVVRNRDIGVFGYGAGTSLTLSEVVVSDTQARERDGVAGRGLSVEDGATADVSRALLSGNRDAGVFVFGAGTSLTLSDVVVRDTRAQESDGGGGAGMRLLQGATVEVSRALFSRNRDIGVGVTHPGTSLALSDVVVRDTQTRERDGTGGRGLDAEGFATADVIRAVLSRNRDVGVHTSQDASVRMTDVIIRDTQAGGNPLAGPRGVNVQEGGSVEIRRGVLARNEGLGIVASGPDTFVTLTDVVVSDTRTRDLDGMGGRGLALGPGATADVGRAVFARNHEIGIFAEGRDTTLTLTDLVLNDTQPRELDDLGGYGLHVQFAATAEVRRAIISGNRGFGVTAVSAGTAVRLLDVVVAQTEELGCAATTCADLPFGVGLLTADHASLDATGFEVQDAALCGVMLTEGGELDLSAGQVSGSRVGACLQNEGYSIARLTDEVRYLDNETNLATTSLPLPEPLGALER